MENRRARSQAFAIFLMIIVALLFCIILAAIVFGTLSEAGTTAIEQWGTALLAIITMAAAYEWGSSKGSAMKDEIAARQAAAAAAAPAPEPPPAPTPAAAEPPKPATK